MSTKRSRRSRLVLGAGVVVVALIVAVAVATRGGSTPTVTAVFDNASPLEKGNLVKANGVVVGQVASIKLVDGKAQVALTLNQSTVPLHRDAQATIEPVSLLGERYIALNPGSDATPLLGQHAVISAAQTGSAVNLDQVLNTLNDPTSSALAALVTTLGSGVQGQGTNTAEALKALAPALTQTGKLSSILNQQNSVLNKLISVIEPNTKAVAVDNGAAVQQLVQKAEQTLSTVAQNRGALDATLNQLPGTLADAQQTLANLAGVADTTTPVLESLRPLTGNLDQVTTELHQFADAANPALGRLPAVLNRLNGLLDQARPLVANLAPGSASLQGITQSILPLGNAILQHPSGVESTLDVLMTGVAEWAMSTSHYDGLSHYFTAAAIVSAVPGELLGGLTGTATSTSPATALPGPAPANAAAAPAPPPPPPPPAAPAPTPNILGPNLNNLLNATGLTPNQEQNLLGELLGGL